MKHYYIPNNSSPWNWARKIDNDNIKNILHKMDEEDNKSSSSNKELTSCMVDCINELYDNIGKLESEIKRLKYKLEGLDDDFKEFQDDTNEELNKMSKEITRICSRK